MNSREFKKRLWIKKIGLMILLIFLTTLVIPLIVSEVLYSRIAIENMIINYAYAQDIEPLWTYETNHVVTCIAISSDGKYITAGNYGGEIYLLDHEGTLQWHSNITNSKVTDIAISSKGQYIVAGNDNGGIYFFKHSNNIPLWSYISNVEIWSVAISGDGQYVAVGDGPFFASGSSQGKIYLFEKSSAKPLWTYSRQKYVWSVSISNDGEYVAAGCADTGVYLLNRNGQIMGNYPLFFSPLLQGVTISPSGEKVVIGRPYGCIDLYNSEGVLQWTYDVGKSISYWFDMSSNSKYIVAGTSSPPQIYFGAEGGFVYLLNYNNGELLWNYHVSGTSAPSVAVSDNGCTAVVGYDPVGNEFAGYYNVFLYNSTGELQWVYDFDGSGSSADVSISDDGKYVVTNSNNNIYLIEGCPEPTIITRIVVPVIIVAIVAGIIIAILVIIKLRRPGRRPFPEPPEHDRPGLP